MAGEVEAYLDIHPFRDWTEDRWDENTSILDIRFHAEDVYFTPLIGNSMIMPQGVDWDGFWRPTTDVVQSHTNHNTIGRYQRMMTPLYIDTRYKKVRARYRWGSKIQLDDRDEMVTRFGMDTPTFITRVLQRDMANNIVAQTERIARDGILTNADHLFMWNGNAFANGTLDFSDIPADESGLFDVKLLEQVALRMSYRSMYTLKSWGSYANPVPGQNFRSSVLIMMTTGGYWGIWNSEEQDYMIDLRQLQDERIINGGEVQYRKFATIQDTKHSLVLWNAGTITTQKAVTRPIKWGDGAPDPATTQVDGVFYAGQSSDNTTHYIQLDSLAAADFAVGDFVSIHLARTDDWGITDGNNFLDGKTLVAEIYTIDATNNRLTFRDPVTEQYEDSFDYNTLNGVASAGQAYAFVTKAQHVHPVYVVGGREMVQWVARRQPDGSLIQFHRPVDTNVDFPSIQRVTANWYGEVNKWSPDLVEIFFCAAQWANRGALEYA